MARPGAAAVAGLVVVLVGVGVWWVWPSPEVALVRARVYRDMDVCLVTGAGGIAKDPASAAWAGMQSYSKASAVRVSYVQVVGADTAANARGFVTGLVQRRCLVVVAVGDAQVGAVLGLAGANSKVGFVVVGSGGGSKSGAAASGVGASAAPAASGADASGASASNVVAVPSGSGVAAGVVAAIGRLVKI